MTEELRAKIAAAVAAAIEAVEDEKPKEEQTETAAEPHRFGTFRLPRDSHIKGLSKFLED